MDAVDFLLYKTRYCDSHFCDECPIYNECEADDTRRAAEKIVEEMEKWAKEHPIITRATVFFNQYPDAPKASDGYPVIGPCAISKKYKDKQDRGCLGDKCLECRKEFWEEGIE